MPEWLTARLGAPAVEPLDVLIRLIAALLLGFLVAAIYRRTRGDALASASFRTTLVLLAILIAMVTQVIGDNIARAFSLVGALSIVRFRTVVRDTQDTAYVIFAVAVGMAVGADNLGVALVGIAIVGVAAVIMRQVTRPEGDGGAAAAMLVRVRLNLGLDAEAVLGATLDSYTTRRRLESLTTARQGLSIDVSYRVDVRSDRAADELVRGVNRIDGVQSVSLERADTANE